MYIKLIKPLFDFLIAIVALLLCLPLIVLVAFFLYVFQDGNVFFTQLRPGRNGVIFKLIKFKTMKDTKDAQGELLPDHKRLTKVGSFVRKTSLDELPQLLNVIKGQMSIVGPRPLLVEYLPLYNTEQEKRHNVKPGITGWAQVNGRNAISWSKKFSLDVWYVNNLSFFLDLRIVFLTVKKVLVKDGISSETSSTMEKFTGN